ncbi:MAG: PRC-barrel domain-containing protein [archaeon]
MPSFKVSHKDERGCLIVRATGISPKIGMPVYGKDGKKAGTVIDVIGNIKSPYLVIKSSMELKEVYLK